MSLALTQRLTISLFKAQPVVEEGLANSGVQSNLGCFYKGLLLGVAPALNPQAPQLFRYEDASRPHNGGDDQIVCVARARHITRRWNTPLRG